MINFLIKKNILFKISNRFFNKFGFYFEIFRFMCFLLYNKEFYYFKDIFFD